MPTLAYYTGDPQYILANTNTAAIWKLLDSPNTQGESFLTVDGTLTKFTNNTGKKIAISITGHISWDNLLTATTGRRVFIVKNGNVDVNQGDYSWSTIGIPKNAVPGINFSTNMVLNAGDYFQVYVWHDDTTNDPNVMISGYLGGNYPGSRIIIAKLDGVQGSTGPTGPAGSTGETGPGFTTISPTGGNDNYVLTAVGNDSSASAEANLTFDGNTLTIGGTVGSTGTALSVIGASAGSILTVTDTTSGTLFSVNNISGTPIFSVNSNGAYYPNSVELNYVNGGPINLITLDASSGLAAWFDYHAYDPSAPASRAGTVTANWLGDLSDITYTDTSTSDVGSSTADLTFDVAISGSDIVLSATATTKTYNIKVGTRVI